MNERTARLVMALVNLAATALVVYLTVDEYRLRRLVEELRSLVELPAPPVPHQPSAADYTAVHERAREITRGEG